MLIIINWIFYNHGYNIKYSFKKIKIIDKARIFFD